jgi:hypothetical protein
MTKECSKCGQVKSIEHFDKCKLVKSGLYPSCKVCRKEWRASHKETTKIKDKEYYDRIKDTEEYKQKWDIYYAKNKEKIKSRVRAHYNDNRTIMNKRANERKSKKYYNDESFNLLCKIRSMIPRTIKGRKCKSIHYVGVETAKQFLDIMSTKTNNPNWINDKYQIDHIWQVHWFEDALRNDPEAVSRIIHNHSNLRPIPANENINRDKFDYTCLSLRDLEKYKPYLNKNILQQIENYFILV